jgi:hypothetical protein
MTTRALAEFTAGIKPDALPPEVMRQAARLVLESHGVYLSNLCGIRKTRNSAA